MSEISDRQHSHRDDINKLMQYEPWAEVNSEDELKALSK